tara:strand:+ start:517 stop:705 length:189 start_codon:yes stop_codon:yes gene_type:complete
MDKELELYGLAYGCPKEQRTACCPFKKIDHLSFIGKVHWLERLNEDQIKAMIEQHKDCSNSR